MHRFYAPALSDDSVFALPADEAHHLARVVRLRAGDSIAVFDGRGREALARIESVTAKRVSARILEPRSAAPEPRVAVTLAQALLKSDKMDRVIRDAVMLGVTAIQPFVSRRTDVPIKAVTGSGPSGSLGSNCDRICQTMRPRSRAAGACHERIAGHRDAGGRRDTADVR